MINSFHATSLHFTSRPAPIRAGTRAHTRARGCEVKCETASREMVRTDRSGER